MGVAVQGFAQVPFSRSADTAVPHATHSHPVCGSSCDCSHTTHTSNLSWTAWNGTSTTYAGRSYYLTRNVTREYTYSFSGSGTIRICLNGYTIRTNGYGVGFEVGENFTLILCDCKGGGGIISDDGEYTSLGSEEYAVYNNGKLTVYGGTLKGGDSAVFNEQDATFSMYGGTLSGAAQSLHNYGTSTIADGTLSPLVSDADGINNHGTLTATGGTVSGYSAVKNYKTLTVTGGTFTGTYQALYNTSTATVSGGRFSSPSSGSTAAVNAGTLHLSGGTMGELWMSTRYSKTYLSEAPSLSGIIVTYPDTLYAANQLQTVPYQGKSIALEVRTYYFSAGDAAVCAVNDGTAPLFSIPEDADYTLVREGSELVVYQEVASGQCGAQGDNLLWSLNNGGTLTITGSGDMADYSSYYGGSYPPPWTKYLSSIKRVVMEEGATSIGSNAFNGFDEITAVELPSTMTRLGDSAFYDAHKLASINLPDRINYIGEYCFQYCYVLAIDRLPTGVKVYQPYSFRNVGADLDSLPALVIPEGVVEIGDGAFAEWYELTSLTLPSTLVTIGDQAFYKNQVSTVHIPASVRSIGSDAFGWETYSSLTYIYFCGDAPDASQSWGRPFRSAGPIKLFFPETAQGFDASAYATYDKTDWPDEEHYTLKGRYVASTCSEGGHYEYYCSLCLQTRKVYDGSAALPHTPELLPGQPATCFEDGLTEGTYCRVCSLILSGHEPIPASHSFGDWSVSTAPTLLLPGEEIRCCSACPETESRILPAIGPASAAGVNAHWDEETRILALSGIPADVIVLAAFYDNNRYVYGNFTTGEASAAITLPEGIAFNSLTLYFITDDWQPISDRRIIF